MPEKYGLNQPTGHEYPAGNSTEWVSQPTIKHLQFSQETLGNNFHDWKKSRLLLIPRPSQQPKWLLWSKSRRGTIHPCWIYLQATECYFWAVYHESGSCEFVGEPHERRTYHGQGCSWCPLWKRLSRPSGCLLDSWHSSRDVCTWWSMHSCWQSGQVNVWHWMPTSGANY